LRETVERIRGVAAIGRSCRGTKPTVLSWKLVPFRGGDSTILYDDTDQLMLAMEPNGAKKG